MQDAFAAHLRHIGRMFPAWQNPRLVILIDNAPWHAGERFGWPWPTIRALRWRG